MSLVFIFVDIWAEKMCSVSVWGCHSPPTAPATPTLQALVHELALVEDWHFFGVNLGLQGHQLYEIERNYREDSNRCKSEMLYLWQRSGKNVTWEAITQALCLMQENVVADRIRRKYCCSSTTTGMCSFRKVGAHNKPKAVGDDLTNYSHSQCDTNYWLFLFSSLLTGCYKYPGNLLNL